MQNALEPVTWRPVINMYELQKRDKTKKKNEQ